MGVARIVILAVAAIAAIGLALVVRNMAVGGRRAAPIQIVQAAPPMQTVKVLVASHDLAVGSRIAPGDVTWQTFPTGGLNPIWIVDHAAPVLIPHIGPSVARADTPGTGISEVTGAVVRIPFLAGEPIVPGKIVKGGQSGYLSVTLQPGMRAVAISLNPQTGVGGFILPGDRVDILLTRKEGASGVGGAAAPTVEMVLRNVQVLAIDQQVQPPKNAKSMIGGSATLAVPAEDVEVLLGAEGRGELALALRSYADLAGSAERGGRGKSDVVTFIRGGQVSEVATR